MDVSGVTAEIAAAGAPIATIGLAVLTILATAAAFKWIRRSM